MMDMEMNAGLDGDDGSETSEATSDGSSASSTFCELERDYSKVLKEMKENEALAPFLAEYTRLFESLYKAHRTEKELMEKCHSLESELDSDRQKVEEMAKTIASNNAEIATLKQEVANTIKRADAAHTREQNAQEMIENLRLNVTQLNQEIEQKNRQLAAGEDGSAANQKENLMKEKERLVSEMDTLRQRLKNMSLYTEELEKKTTEAENQISEMQETLDMQMSDISKERRLRQRTEDELHQLQDELHEKVADLETANSNIQAAAANVMKLESLLKEQRLSGEKMQKEISKLMVKRLNLQTDYDNAAVQIEKLDKDIEEKDKQLKQTKQIVHKAKTAAEKSQIERDAMAKRLQKVEADRMSLEQQLKQANATTKNVEHEIFLLRKQQNEKQNQYDVLLREKNVLARTKENLNEQIKRLNHEMMVHEYSRRKIEHEFDDLSHDVAEVKKELTAAEKDRDKYNTETQNLAQEVEDYISEVKLKQVEIFNYKKRLAECEARYRQQQNLFEAVRAERNSYSKSLTESVDEIQELKNKLKVVNHQIEQLKEDIVAKEALVIKEEFLRGRVEKEKESLKVELQSSRKEVTDLKREIETMKQEEKSLRQVIQRAESDIGRHKKDIDNVMNERDILGTQLVRRNDELSLQYSRIKVLHGTLQRGEEQYNQRLEDIRLLKLEVKNLRTEKVLLTKNIANMSDLRQEVFHLNRDLTKERLKVMALEEEVQTPLNIHRWRKLEGTDPSTYELLMKIQILQKRVLGMASAMIEKEKKIKDTERLYMNLREILSKHPGPHVAISLNKTQKALRERGQKMKCMLAELSMYEVQIGEYRVDMDRMNGQMSELKMKYYAQKRKLQKSKESKLKSVSEPTLPAVSRSTKKFCGGGFNMVTPTPRNCFGVDSVCR
ncbi:cilia- and flagella-associated protein 58-like isoform X2 [Hylaeus anthracinus]|uniref:cilia- and flagella-associated protein 58-like isoform X2 n=1 Tax=Hylaeus anthracinus TaxID=313031 RepID=UPI0023B890E1|nr:cilia- and flagella-associated protein 58-like isoform X2 [Hylaeus anthracinus]